MNLSTAICPSITRTTRREGDNDMNAPVTTKTALVSTDAGTTPVSYFEHGQGHPFVVLHGGAGSNSVREFVKLLATTRHARVIAPIHPGFDGTLGLPR